MQLDDSENNWKELYIAAILEIDSEKVLLRIHDAKMAICDRVEELNGGGKAAERTALGRAMRALTELQDVYCGAVRDDSRQLFRRPAHEARTAQKQDAA